MRIRGYAPGAPCWTHLSTPDPDSAQRFYTALFGWTTRRTDGYTLFRTGDRVAAGLAQVHDPLVPDGWLMYVTVSDVDITAKVVDAAGGRVLRPPADLGDAGRTALFADPAGAVFAGWQPGVFRGAQAFVEPGAVCWYGLATPEPYTARVFYGEVFGWRDRPDPSAPGGYEWINGEDVVAGVLPAGPGEPVGWTAYLMVADCAAAVAGTIALGGRAVGAPVDTPLCRYVHLAYPGGARFAVLELAPEVRRALR